MGAYWDLDTAYGSDVRWRLTVPLAEALGRNDDILLISHSLGTTVAYDVLWKFSHYGEYQHIRDRTLSLLVTLGSPLGDETVKNNLKGSGAGGLRRYPHNIGNWINIAAEDDYISHDEEIANDYQKMLRSNLVESINDHKIYNLALRHGKSNPHHAVGYLIHPTVSQIVADWLT